MNARTALTRRVGPVSLGVALGAFVALGAAAAAVTVVVSAAGTPPANDEFLSAESLTDVQIVGDLTDATGSTSEVAAGVIADGERAVWFTWTPPLHGWAFVSPTDAGEARPLPEIAVFTGDAIDALIRVDEPSGEAGATSVPVVAGTTYSIAVVGADDAAGFDLSVFQPDAGTRLNDEPEAAIAVGASVFDAVAQGGAAEAAVDTLGGATAAPGEPDAAGTLAEHSVWYAWDVPLGGGSVTFAVEPTVAGGGPFRLASWSGTSIADVTLLDAGGSSVTITGAEGDRVLVSVDGPEEFYRLTVTESGVEGEDVTPPVVSCADVPDSWSPGPVVTVSCTATDGGSGLESPATDAAFDLRAELEGAESDALATPSRTVCDVAGNCETVGPFEDLRIDQLPPEVLCDEVPADWLADNPEVTCVATDGGSGLADPADADRVVTTDVAAGEQRAAVIPAREVCDNVDNCTDAPEIGPVMVDRAGPTVVCDPAPTGVQTAEVEVRCEVTDAGSGLTDPALSEGVVLRTDVGTAGADLDASTNSVEVCDVVGNCVEVGPVTGLEIDRAAPSVNCDPPADWSTTDVEITCEIADDGVGLAAGIDETIVLTATLPAGEESDAVVSTSAEACDAVDNCAAVGPFTVRIDKRAPAIDCPEAPEEWSAEAEVIVTCSATDDGSGLAEPESATVQLEATLPAGEESDEASTSSVEVCDDAGNCDDAGPVTGIRIDRKAPAVDCDDPPAGTSLVEVAVGCEASDGGSGLRTADDESFSLSTSVGEGNADPAAETGTREVCDLAGNCDDAGPFTASVDRSEPSGGAVEVEVPDRVTVLAAVAPPGPVAVPYEPPSAPDVDVACVPAPGTVLREGWVIISCDASASDGARSTVAFPLVVKPLPSLAPSGGGISGGAWRAVGVGFEPGSAVRAEVDGDLVATGAAGPDGRVSIEFTLPASLNPGTHQVVLRGVDGGDDPMLVVSEVAVLPPLPGEEPPTEVPGTAPTLPEVGPAVPPDPGPPPPLPDFDRGTAPVTTTTSTVPPGPTTTIRPGETTTTTAGGSPGDTTTSTSPDGTTDPTDPSAGDPPGEDPDPDVDDGAGPALLPVTGGAIGGLVVLGLLLLAGGGSLRAGARRFARRNPADASDPDIH